MPQLDLNTFAGLAWWLTTVFYLSYIFFLMIPFAQVVAAARALEKYRFYKMLETANEAEDIKK